MVLKCLIWSKQTTLNISRLHKCHYKKAFSARRSNLYSMDHWMIDCLVVPSRNDEFLEAVNDSIMDCIYKCAEMVFDYAQTDIQNKFYLF